MAGPQHASSPPPRTVIPKLVTDPVASLRPWSVTVTVAGESHTIAPFPAATWLDLLMGEGASLADIFPGLAGQQAREAVTEAIIEGFYTLDMERELVLSILDTVGGRPWWITMRLIRIVTASWDYLGGEISMRGVDATKLSLAGWLDAVFHIILRSMDQKDHNQFLLRLEMVPAEVAAEQPEPQMSAAEFGALMT